LTANPSLRLTLREGTSIAYSKLIAAVVEQLPLMSECLSGLKDSWLMLEESHFNKLIAKVADSIMIVLLIHFQD